MAATVDGALESIRQLDEHAAGDGAGDELDRRFDAIVAGYVALPETDRLLVRAAYNRCTTWATFEFWMETPSYALRFERHGHEVDLRRALAHYSISNGYPDARDAVVAICGLVASAAERAIDAGPVMREMAAISSQEDSTGIGPLGDYFERYAPDGATKRA